VVWTLVIGDSHGSRPMLREALRLAEHLGIGTVVSVGDFGIWPGPSGKQFLDTVEQMAARRGVEVLVVPGNHDDYDQLDAADLDEDGWLTLRPHVRAAPRGQTWTDTGGLTWQAMGGAASPDGPGGIFEQVRGPLPRTHVEWRDGRFAETGHGPAVDLAGWWPAERITDREIDTAIAAADGHRVDVLITHDAPAAVPGPAGAVFPAGDEQRRLLQRLLDATRPALNVHGHWHLHAHHHIADTEHVTLSADVNPDQPQWCLVGTVDSTPAVRVPELWSTPVALTSLGRSVHQVRLTAAARAVGLPRRS
jgi:Icc-related predicted phosphoesterase